LPKQHATLGPEHFFGPKLPHLSAEPSGAQLGARVLELPQAHELPWQMPMTVLKRGST
jgi:hypothetical protein